MENRRLYRRRKGRAVWMVVQRNLICVTENELAMRSKRAAIKSNPVESNRIESDRIGRSRTVGRRRAPRVPFLQGMVSSSALRGRLERRWSGISESGLNTVPVMRHRLVSPGNDNARSGKILLSPVLFPKGSRVNRVISDDLARSRGKKHATRDIVAASLMRTALCPFFSSCFMLFLSQLFSARVTPFPIPFSLLSFLFLFLLLSRTVALRFASRRYRRVRVSLCASSPFN